MLVCCAVSQKWDTWPDCVIIAQQMEQQAANKLLTKCAQIHPADHCTVFSYSMIVQTPWL